MKPLYRLLTLAPLIALLSCSTDDPITNPVMYYYETKCADVWGTGQNSTDAEVIDAAGTFVADSLNVPFTSMTVSNDPNEAELCEACFCQTGRVITVVIDNPDNIQILLDNDFEE